MLRTPQAEPHQRTRPKARPIASCCWHGHVARHPLPEPPDKTYGTESAGEKRKGGGQWCLSYLEDADSREGTGGAEFTSIIAGAIASEGEHVDVTDAGDQQ